jgi:hypothetical protein
VAAPGAAAVTAAAAAVAAAAAAVAGAAAVAARAVYARGGPVAEGEVNTWRRRLSTWATAAGLGAAAACGGTVVGDEPDSGSAGGMEPNGTGGGGTGAAGTGAGGIGGRQMPPCTDIQGVAEGCDFVAQQVHIQTANLLLVVDRSASMADEPSGYPMNKWDMFKAALGQLLPDMQGAFWFGLELFPTTATPGNPIPVQDCTFPQDRCCEMPGDLELNVQMGPGADTVPLIISTLDATLTVGGAPTAVALQRAYAYFTQGRGALLEGDQYVLLATDGAPSCNPALSCTVDSCTLNIDNTLGCPSPEVDPNAFSCCGQRPQACLDDQQTMSAIAQLASIGVATIVVGIPGVEIYRETLESMALQSSFQRATAEPPYYLVWADGSVSGLGDLAIELVPDCRVDVSGLVQRPNEVNVAIDCVLVPRGQPGGDADRWYFENPDDPRVIIIAGQICDRIRTQSVGRIDLVLECPTVTDY